MAHARGTFDISLRPGASELDDRVGRFEFAKNWTGDLVGTGSGLMLSGGDPQTGTAGYVAAEVFAGTLSGREGGFALQQFGQLDAGAQRLTYEITKGSGTGELAGIKGEMSLVIDADGSHTYEMDYDLP